MTEGPEWATVERLSGSLRWTSSSGLADCGIADALQTTEKTILRTQQVTATAAWDLHSRFNLEARVENDSLAYSSDADRPLDTQQDVLGVHYGADLGWTVAMGGRITRGVYPVLPARTVRLPDFQPDDVHRRDFDLLSVGSHASKTNVTEHVSRSLETHSQPSQPGFSGFTGSILIDYAPTSKLRLSASASRDTGTTAGSLNVNASKVSSQVYVSASFAATPKINLGVEARHSRGENGSPFGSSRDSNGAYVLRASYEPRPILRLSTASIARFVRRRRRALDSQATVLGCSGVATIQ